MELNKPIPKTGNFHNGYVLFFNEKGEYSLDLAPASLPEGYLYGIELSENGPYVFSTKDGTKYVMWHIEYVDNSGETSALAAKSFEEDPGGVFVVFFSDGIDSEDVSFHRTEPMSSVIVSADDVPYTVALGTDGANANVGVRVEFPGGAPADGTVVTLKKNTTMVANGGNGALVVLPTVFEVQ